MNPSYVLAMLCSAFLLPFSIDAEKSKPNILIVTVDDMSCGPRLDVQQGTYIS